MRAPLVVLPLGLTLLSCGGYESAAPTTLSLTGSWSGLLGESQSGSALRVTWAITQTGSNAAGTATLVKPAAGVVANGTVAGHLTGNQLSITLLVPPGNVPGFAACTIAGSGTGTADAASISGTLSATFTSCAGSGLEPPSSNRLTLSRQ